jgi:general bacterial porin, GBP family
MKSAKYLLVPALSLMAGIAHAQSSVSLYGSIDEGLEYVSNIGGHSAYALVSNTQQFGSSWGLKGQEDLGGGLKAVFQLENGFDLSNGATLQSGQIFGRQAYVGLTSDNFGTLTLGRQYDSVVDFVAPLSAAGAWGGTLFAHPFDADNLNESFRIDNSIKYTSASYSGLQLGAVYGLSNQAGAFADNRAWSIGARYQNGPLTAAAAFMNVDNASANSTGAVVDSPYMSAQQRVAGGGLNYAFGPAVFGLVYTHTDIIDRPDFADGTLKFDNVELNAKYNVSSSWYVAAMYLYTSESLTAAGFRDSPHRNEFGLMLDYRLSKRTDLYLQGVYEKASGQGVFGDVGNNDTSSTQNQTVTRIGIRTSF